MTCAQISLVEWFADNYTKFGTTLEFVTNRSQEGNQFCKGFGGVGGLLRWKVRACFGWGGWMDGWDGLIDAQVDALRLDRSMYSALSRLFTTRRRTQVDFAEHNEDTYGDFEDDDDDDHDEADYDDPF